MKFRENSNEWDQGLGYRLGDMVRGAGGDKTFESSLTYHKQRFPHSIVTEYWSKTDEFNDFPCLHDIVKNRLSEKLDVVVMLRLGDMFSLPKRDHPKEIDYQIDQISDFLSSKTREIVIDLGFHRKLNESDFSQSLNFLSKLFFLLSKFHRVKVCINENADISFARSCACQTIVFGGFTSGFHSVIKNVRNIDSLEFVDFTKSRYE